MHRTSSILQGQIRAIYVGYRMIKVVTLRDFKFESLWLLYGRGHNASSICARTSMNEIKL